KVVADQIGGPTYARDLAEAVMKIIKELYYNNTHAGIYHYCNSGIISWHQFALEIQNLSGLTCNVVAIPTSEYPTPAKRSPNSAMDTSK
ncbi:sugar nucleotide-binding protein, partial [Klebsiella pneumoniae]|uniref:sugar nucleotide-binding protein n=1 Tax=Klebsiella pneumoniae TaxID=573 RepID=UPI003852B175